MGLLLALYVGVVQGFASPYFTPLRDDQSVPENCREMKLGFYQLPSETIYIGRKGAQSMGFTMEYPVSRKNATVLWHYFKAFAQGVEKNDVLEKILGNAELKRDYEIILRNYQEQDFDFSNEGEILEALAIHQLYQEFPSNHYYITGGVEYHEANSPMTIGEIDLFVGLKNSCEAVVVGEVKLGRGKMLNKAKKQIQRFENFLVDHNAAGFGDEYDMDNEPHGHRTTCDGSH